MTQGSSQGRQNLTANNIIANKQSMYDSDANPTDNESGLRKLLQENKVEDNKLKLKTKTVISAIPSFKRKIV